MRNSKGQSSVEAAIMAFILIVFVIAFIATLYLMYASYWAEHILYESLICYQERGNKTFCSHNARKKIKDILLFEEMFTFKMQTAPSMTYATLQMKIRPPLLENKTLTFQKGLRI